MARIVRSAPSANRVGGHRPTSGAPPLRSAKRWLRSPPPGTGACLVTVPSAAACTSCRASHHGLEPPQAARTVRHELQPAVGLALPRADRRPGAVGLDDLDGSGGCEARVAPGHVEQVVRVRRDRERRELGGPAHLRVREAAGSGAVARSVPFPARWNSRESVVNHQPSLPSAALALIHGKNESGPRAVRPHDGS